MKGDTSQPQETTRPKDNHWLARLGTVRAIRTVSVAVLAVTLVPGLFVDQHVEFGIEDRFGFYAWYGFLSCVAMVLFAKGVGSLLKRGDRYYGD